MATVMLPPIEQHIPISATKLLINNRWVESESDGIFATVSPPWSRCVASGLFRGGLRPGCRSQYCHRGLRGGFPAGGYGTAGFPSGSVGVGRLRIPPLQVNFPAL